MEKTNDTNFEQIDIDLTKQNDTLQIDQTTTGNADMLNENLVRVPKIGRGAESYSERDTVRTEKKRRNNAIQSARKRERQKSTTDKLKSLSFGLYEANLGLFRKNQVLEVLLKKASSFVDPDVQQQVTDESLVITPQNNDDKMAQNLKISSAPWANMQRNETYQNYPYVGTFDTLSCIGAPTETTLGTDGPRAPGESYKVLRSECAEGIIEDAKATPNQAVFVDGAVVDKAPPTIFPASHSLYPNPSDVTTISGIVDVNTLYQNLLPTLLLMEAGVDPLPILQQKIAQHISSIAALQQKEVASNFSRTDFRQLTSEMGTTPNVKDENVSINTVSHQCTHQSTGNTMLQESNITDLAQNFLLQWLASKNSDTAKGEKSSDEQPTARR